MATTYPQQPTSKELDNWATATYYFEGVHYRTFEEMATAVAWATLNSDFISTTFGEALQRVANAYVTDAIRSYLIKRFGAGTPIPEVVEILRFQTSVR